MSSIKLTSDTLNVTPGPGEIEYNGQFFATDSASSRAQMIRLSQQTSITANAIHNEFLNIPAWVKRITFGFNSVQSPATQPILQLGTSSAYETTGYAGGVNGNNVSTGFAPWGSQTTNTVPFSGAVVITLVDASTNMWSEMGVTTNSTNGNTHAGGGTKLLPGILTRIRLTTAAGTAAYNGGTVSVLYEG